MESILFGLVPLVVAVVLLFSAFRAHERYWALGFMGWRRVYAGLILYLFSGILTAVWQWTATSGPEAIGRLVLWQITSALAAAAGIGLVLAGAIERLRELSEERDRLEDIRAGFDLFDSLREIVAQPYAFLEILDFSLKEMVRAAGVESGGLWLYNPGKSEWVLTGWASMTEKLRQQTESVRGSGTGFDRLAVTHKARLFHSTGEIRAFFPEWEPEGYQSILGLPLATGTVGTPGRQILGAIILADRSPSHFDDDRARRLYAASDYIAAVIAEARITRQLEAARQQLDSTQAEWERDRLESQRQREASEKRIQEMTAASEEEKRSLEENLASQVAEVRMRAKEEIDRTRAEFETRAAASAAAEQERTSQLQQRWEEARRDYESAQGRFENERAEWGRRLDQLNQDLQTERDLARRREEQLVASNQEALAATQRRIDELQLQLSAEQQKVAAERDALHSAGQTLAELESALTAERNARENAVADMTARIENERRTAAQDRLAIEQELHATRQILEEREKHMSAHLVAAHQAATEAQTHYQDTLQAQREAAARTISDLQAQLRQTQERWQSVEQELQSIRLMFDEREKQFAARIEAERRAFKESEAGHFEALSDERCRAEDALRDLENRLRTQRDRSESLESDLRSVLDEKAAFEERLRQDLVEQHLNSRRQINAVKARRASLMDRIQSVLALTRDEQRLSALFRSVSDDLPSPVAFYLWRRDPERGAHLVAWMDCDRVVHTGSDLAPWSFEVGTIPAEGVTRFSGSQRWDDIERTHDDAHRAQWREHWGGERRPAWVTCWPWRISLGDSDGETGFTTGWLTAFGFGPQVIDDEQVVHGGQWVGFIAAASVGVADTAFATARVAAQSVDVADAVPDFRIQEPPVELNNVILDWAAGQTEDALRLDLSARSRVAVDRSWLREVLDRGCRLCRGAEPQGGEFSVSTESHNGRTVLRLIRSSGEHGQAPSDITGVDDTDLTAMQVNDQGGSESGRRLQSGDTGAVSARWLIHGGDRLGLELHFSSVPAGAASVMIPADVPDRDRTFDIMVVNFQNAMNELVVGMLEALGHRARSVDLASARDLVVSQEFGLVIVSATPEQAGWEFARWMKNTIPASPVIVVSDDVPATPEGVSCDQMLRIPFQIEELDEAITGLTARAMVLQVRQ